MSANFRDFDPAASRGMLAHLFGRREHVILHRLWMFATLQAELTRREHAHLLDCEECRFALQKSMKAESFGAVLKELRETFQGPSLGRRDSMKSYSESLQETNGGNDTPQI